MISFNWLETGLRLTDAAATKSWLMLVIQSESKKCGDIHFIFCSDDHLLEMNRHFLSHDTYTDILTFPLGTSSETLSGEIYISLDRVGENATRFGADPHTELRRVMVHGILHLAGYDDASSAEKQLMRAKEDYYLNLHP